MREKTASCKKSSSSAKKRGNAANRAKYAQGKGTFANLHRKSEQSYSLTPFIKGLFRKLTYIES
jgi:hypothetical protein